MTGKLAHILYYASYLKFIFVGTHQNVVITESSEFLTPGPRLAWKILLNTGSRFTCSSSKIDPDSDSIKVSCSLRLKGRSFRYVVFRTSSEDSGAMEFAGNLK